MISGNVSDYSTLDRFVSESQGPRPVAPRWRRGAARGIDLAVLGLFTVGLLFVAHKFGFERAPISDAIIFGTFVAYEVLVPLLAQGRTIGKALLAVAIAGEDTVSSPSVIKLSARFAARVAMFAILTVFVAYELGHPSLLAVLLLEAVVGAIHPRRQTIGDLVGRTLVVQTNRAVAHAAA